MKISEVASQSGLATSTVKYYLREGLLHAGERRGSNQTAYDDSHVRRLKLVRALVETGGLSIAQAKNVLVELDSEAGSPHAVFRAAQHALGVGGASIIRAPDTGDHVAAEARSQVAALVAARGWAAEDDNPGFDVAARAIQVFLLIGYNPSTEYLAAYADAAEIIARADLNALANRTSPDLVAELMVVGTVIGDALIAGLRRLTQENETSAIFFPSEPDRKDNGK